MMSSLKFLLTFVFFITPSVISAQGIVPCSGTDCDFGHVIQLIANLLKFFVLIAIPLAAISFAWAGFIYMTSGGNPGKVSKAHGIFKKVGIGLVIVLTAYTIVRVIISALTDWNSPEEIVSLLSCYFIL